MVGFVDNVDTLCYDPERNTDETMRAVFVICLQNSILFHTFDIDYMLQGLLVTKKEE